MGNQFYFALVCIAMLKGVVGQCAPNPCDHGTCTPGPGSDFSCNCQENWTGKTCSYLALIGRSRIFGNIGQNAYVQCIINTTDTYDRVIWEYGGSEVARYFPSLGQLFPAVRLENRSAYSHSQVEEGIQSRLIIMNLSNSDLGQYVCTINIPQNARKNVQLSESKCLDKPELYVPTLIKNKPATINATGPCSLPAYRMILTYEDGTDSNSNISEPTGGCSSIISDNDAGTSLVSLTFATDADNITVTFQLEHPCFDNDATGSILSRTLLVSGGKIIVTGPGCEWWCILIIIVVILICGGITIWICMCTWCPTTCCQFCREKELNKPLCDCCKPPGWVGTQPGDCNHKGTHGSNQRGKNSRNEERRPSTGSTSKVYPAVPVSPGQGRPLPPITSASGIKVEKTDTPRALPQLPPNARQLEPLDLNQEGETKKKKKKKKKKHVEGVDVEEGSYGYNSPDFEQRNQYYDQ